MDDPIAQQVALDAVVTLVDAKHIAAHLEDLVLDGADNQAVDQIVCADRIVINKIDLVTRDDIASLTQRIRTLNETAEIVTSSYAQIDLARILGVGASEFSQILVEADGLHGDDHDHHHETGHDDHQHDQSVTSVGIEVDADVDLEVLHAWLAELRLSDASNLFRMKGILAVQGQAHRYVLQGVHNILELRAAQVWGCEPRKSRIVFIGRDLDRAALTDRFHACLAVPIAA